MGLREVTGYIAHALLGGFWVWVVLSTAPQLRKGVRERGLRLRIALVKTAGLGVAFLAVGVIHFWGTQWWHIVAAAVGAVLLCVLLRRAYGRLVAPPRHRITLRQRALVRRYPAVRVPPPRSPADAEREPAIAIAMARHRHRRGDLARSGPLSERAQSHG